MKNMEAIPSPSEAKSVLHTCTQTILNPHENSIDIVDNVADNTTKTCQDAVNQLSSEFQKNLCDNPLALINEKNIFTFGESIFNPSIERMGCHVAIPLLMLPFKTIQEIACNLISTNSSVIEAKAPLGLESLGQRCEMTVSKPTKQKLAACHPTYNATDDEKAIRKDLKRANERCKAVMPEISDGDKIKLCDSNRDALTEPLPPEMINQLISSLQKAPFNASSPKLTVSEYHEQKKNREIQLDKLHSGNRIIERNACQNLQRPDFPFEKDKPLSTLMQSHCFMTIFFSRDFKRPHIAQVPTPEKCKKFILSLEKEEQTRLCEKNTREGGFFPRYKESPYISTINSICQNDTDFQTENSTNTFTHIRRGRAAENDSINRDERHLPFSVPQLELKQPINKLSSPAFNSTHQPTLPTPATPAADCRHPTTLGVIAGGGIAFALTGIGCCIYNLWNKNRSATQSKTHREEATPEKPLTTSEVSLAQVSRV